MRLIDADMAIEELTDRSHQAAKEVGIDSPFWEGLVIARRIVNNLPTIQPELTDEQVIEYCKKKGYKIVSDDLFNLLLKPELKEGHWIPHESPDGGVQYECSRCGVLWEFTDGTPEDNEAFYCPNCGARMKGERQK